MICVICFEERDVLKTVGECKHRFCFSCLFGHLEKYCSGRTFPCPSCQADCLLPRDELDGLADFTGEDDDMYFDCTTDGEPSEECGAVRELGEACGAVRKLDVDSGVVRELGEECDTVMDPSEKSGSIREIGEACGPVRELDVESGAVRKLDLDSGAVRKLDEECGAGRELGAECGAVREQTADPSGRLESMSTWASVPTTLTTPSNNYAVDRVKQVVFRLTVAPGNLEEFMIPLVGDLNITPVDLNTVIDIINVIFEQAVVESNFTYTGARMCDWFVREYKPLTDGQPIKFLSLLMKRCQLEQENSLVLAQENPARLQGFTLFMAELFQNVKIVTQEAEERIEVLGKKLKELVRILLQHLSDSNLKCVVRILKCTGAVLEDTERLQTGQAVDMDSLINLCLQQAMSPNASESVRVMLTKVAEIRSTNWGRMESAPVQVMAPQQTRAPSPFTQSDPVFFDQYGQMITREEAGFAEGELEYSYGDEYQDQWSSEDLQYQEQEFDPSLDNGYLDTEIDAEIAEAFEQFLIDTQQA